MKKMLGAQEIIKLIEAKNKQQKINISSAIVKNENLEEKKEEEVCYVLNLESPPQPRGKSVSWRNINRNKKQQEINKASKPPVTNKKNTIFGTVTI